MSNDQRTPSDQQRTTERCPPTTIHCSSQPGDALCVKDAALGHGYVNIQTVDLTHDDNSGPAVLLDKAKARELFNWLGVWLHTV